MKKNIIIILLSINLILIIGLAITFITDENKEQCNVSKCTFNEDAEEGVITSITPNGDYGTILVEKGTFKAYVTINKETIITKTIYSRTFDFNELNMGDTIEVEFTGPVQESYPVQGTAKWIHIIGKLTESDTNN